MAVYGYCRVSTDRQAGNGESLGAQRRTIEGYAMMMGMKIDQMFVERGVSGSKPLAEAPRAAGFWPQCNRTTWPFVTSPE
jgi:putative DNA-invertase from lambdoid prophage Rac